MQFIILISSGYNKVRPQPLREKKKESKDFFLAERLNGESIPGHAEINVAHKKENYNKATLGYVTFLFYIKNNGVCACDLSETKVRGKPQNRIIFGRKYYARANKFFGNFLFSSRHSVVLAQKR